jgi:hypothetical protein
MPFVSFHDYFPDLAEEETRCMTVFNDPLLPPDVFALTELYCDELDCDCRRVFFDIISSARRSTVAVIAYGWETEEFYRNWSHSDDPIAIHDLKGPVLNLGSRQSELAPVLLEQIQSVVLANKRYVERLERHYHLFKNRIAGFASRPVQHQRSSKVGRNDPCPCGSGKKFKHCCQSHPRSIH